MNFLRLLLFPFSLLFAFVTGVRNLLYDYRVLSTKSFEIPIISVGNLSVGGTGKTPHVEYLVRLLRDFKVATLSRGYGRKTRGFLQASAETTASQVGDEPFQMYQKFTDVDVFVDEKRVRGVEKIQQLIENIEVIVLDDAFQHRKIEPGINVLLTEYHNLYKNDFILPTGNLRELKSGANRADIIIVTKTPEVFSPLERRIIAQELNPKPHQQVFFSYMDYGSFTPLKRKVLWGTEKEGTIKAMPKEYYFSRSFSCLLVTGIAKATPLKYFLEQNLKKVTHLSFKDHHQYNHNDVRKIRGIFDGLKEENKFIVTTEKDAGRLLDDSIKKDTLDLPIFYLPIEAKFHEKDKEEFEELILSYVGRN